jgi:AcrR family transcriptional regulator
VDDKILSTTRQLLAADGYMRMTVDAVARAAGATRPTIYLRWPSKADLVIAAVADLERPDATQLSGDTLTDLKTILHELKVSFVDHGNAELFGPMFTERHHEPELIEQFRKRLLTPRRNRLVEVLEQGAEKGDVRVGIDIDAVVNAMVGSMYAKVMTGEAVSGDFASRIVDAIWAGIAVSRPNPSGDS